jgi:hypothetical protein
MENILPNINNASRQSDQQALLEAKAEEEYFEELVREGKAIKTVTPVSQGYRVTYKKI